MLQLLFCILLNNYVREFKVAFWLMSPPGSRIIFEEKNQLENQHALEPKSLIIHVEKSSWKYINKTCFARIWRDVSVICVHLGAQEPSKSIEGKQESFSQFFISLVWTERNSLTLEKNNSSLVILSQKIRDHLKQIREHYILCLIITVHVTSGFTGFAFCIINHTFENISYFYERPKIFI